MFTARRTLLIGMLALTGGLANSALAQNAPLRVVTDATFPPMEFVKDGKRTGCSPPPQGAVGIINPFAEVETSPVAHRLVVLVLLYRVHFRCGRSGSFRCSPPRLAATRLLQVLTSPTVADGRGLPPRRSAQLRSARAWASRPLAP